MSIPLVQKAEKDDINTSIIAIKRNIERINMLLGLVDSGGSDPDLSGLATKQELQDAVESLQPVDEVTIDNMQSVTSNAVAEAMSYSTTEHKTGRYWTDGKPTYEKTIQTVSPNASEGWFSLTDVSVVPNVAQYVKIRGIMNHANNFIEEVKGVYGLYNNAYYHLQVGFTGRGGTTFLTLEYTKTTD